MIILQSAVKADLFPGAPAGPAGLAFVRGRGTARTDLPDLDAHFWDWNLWLGANSCATRMS
jgi:hypothetical protein